MTSAWLSAKVNAQCQQKVPYDSGASGISVPLVPEPDKIWPLKLQSSGCFYGSKSYWIQWSFLLNIHP